VSSQQATGTGSNADTTFVEGAFPAGVGHTPPGAADDIPTFTSIGIKFAQVSGQYLGQLAQPPTSATQYDLKEGKDVQIAASAISPFSQNFNLFFRHNQ
jgi:hypothetical protein